MSDSDSSQNRDEKPFVSLEDRPIEEQEAFWAAMKGLEYEDMTPEQQYWFRISDDDDDDWFAIEDAPTMDWVLEELTRIPARERSSEIGDAILALRTLTRQVKDLQSYVKELKEIIIERARNEK